MNRFTHKISKIIAVCTLICLLLPLFATAITATPTEESSPVWNGGASEAFEGRGTQSSPYLIHSGEDLALLSTTVRDGTDYTGKYFKLSQTIQLNETASYDTWNQTPPQRSWIPIGGYTVFEVNSPAEFESAISKYNELYVRTDNSYQIATAYTAETVYYRLTAFNGHLNGDGHSISGMYVAHTESYAGLFAVLGNATIQNLTLTSAYVEGNKHVGILAGAVLTSTSTDISNIRSEGTISALDGAGGLLGYAEASGTGKISLSNCSFNGTLTGETNIGGILGKTGTSTGSVVLSHCNTEGTISATSNIGGILGHLTGAGDQILSCKSNCSIIGNNYVGGIVGAAEPAIGTLSISDCQNGGVLLTDHTTGGIVGGALTTTDGSSIDLLNCRNIGEIHSGESVGGIVGKAQLKGNDSTIRLQGCKNSALLQGSQAIGGIIGLALVENGTFSVSTCENYGNLNATNNFAGGIIGECRSKSRVILTMCSVRAAIHSDSSFAGGIAGALTAQSGSLVVEMSGATGTVSANASAGGLVGKMSAEAANSTALIQNCIAANTINSTESLGGIVGNLYADHGSVSVLTSLFVGTITSGCKLYGGISADLNAIQPHSSAVLSNCYYTQSATSTPTHLLGGNGTETLQSVEARTEEEFRNNENLSGLDSAIWQFNPDSKHSPTPIDLPLVWEEFHYTVTQNGAILLSYLGRSDIVHVPDRLGGINITTIAASAFEQNSVIRVILPNSITAIGEAAFAGCTRLECITLPTSLISIGARAFSQCTSLSALRCTSLLSTTLIGSENDPYLALPITRPITIPVTHLYEDGSIAGKATSLSCYIGDYYSIEPLTIKGYQADTTSLSGIAQSADRITVVYHIGTYHLSVRYLYPNGTEAFPSFEGDFRYGDKYSVSTPILDGYKADYTLVEGFMEGNDLQLIVHYTEIFENDSTDDQQTLHIILLIISGLTTVCCLCYFIYRYRSVIEQAKYEDE